MSSNPIISILCIGFHHKKGCQVEFCYPPLIESGKAELVGNWKYLSSLALPDGSHNFTEDTVFFNIPSLYDPKTSCYGISCYRQIPVEKLKNKTADITRSTVQKSVCILSTLPIYGYIEVKLALIADAFFEQGDFSQTDILIKAYEQLNSCLLPEPNPMRHFHVGLNLRDIILKWKHKVLILSKLFLLQRRVVCFGSPVRETCTLIIGISSLFPRLIEKGFIEVACVQTLDVKTNFDNKNCITNEIATAKEAEEDYATEEAYGNSIDNEKLDDTSPVDYSENGKESSERKNSVDEVKRTRLEHLQRDASADTLSSTLFPLASINPDSYNSPIPIFNGGNLCFPYLSLSFMDLLTDPSVHSYIIGTSNYLFQQKKNLSDIQIDIENGNLDIIDPELKRQLVLTTEDLRFMDFILKHVQNPREDAEGSENWIRNMFQGYMLALIKTTLFPDNAKDSDHFNNQFITAFRKTQCYNTWYEGKPDNEFFDAVASGHPFAGNLSISDVKLKLTQTIQGSESGRKIHQTVNTTVKSIGQVFKMGSNLWSSMTTNSAANNSNEVQIAQQNAQIAKRTENDFTEKNSIEKIESCQEICENIKKEDEINKSNNGIVEVAKEAELLDKKNKIYTI